MSEVAEVEAQSVDYFDAVKTPLLPGVNLIEASAGTGKTFSIAMLLLRFVVEKNIALEKMLVVTFTRAATQELKDRIRRRLSEARQLLAGSYQGGDPTLIAWGQSIEDTKTAQQRIAIALTEIDSAPILTIHGFCQRVLRQFALESGQFFDADLQNSIDPVRLDIAQDYWRKTFYPLKPSIASVISESFTDPADLLKSLKDTDQVSQVLPAPEKYDFDSAIQQIESVFEQLSGLNEAVFQPLIQAHADDPSRFGKHLKEHLLDDVQQLRDWLSNPYDLAVPIDVLRQFTHGALLASGGLNGRKFPKKGDLTSEQRKQDFLDEISFNSSEIDRLLEEFDQLVLAFRYGLLKYSDQELTQRLQRERTMSFNDLIVQLSEVLSSEQGLALTELLQSRYQVALIDEFQDTDSDQWSIFSTLFSAQTNKQTLDQHYLYLIGDPKQAIYKFRGADIYSYLLAKQRVDQQYFMQKNWRSHRHLVEAVNHLYQVNSPFLIDDIDYNAVEAHKQKTYLGDGQQHDWHKMVLWSLPDNPGKKPEWKKGEAQALIRNQVVAEMLSLLQSDIQIDREGDQALVSVSPQDMAVLVRSNYEAAAYQQALQAVGIPAVLSSRESVFTSEDAFVLYDVLNAIVHHHDVRILRQAMVQDWFGLSGQAYYRQLDDSLALEQWISRFRSYHQLWQSSGVMLAMRDCLRDYQVFLNLAVNSNVERRISNIIQLIELIQMAEQQNHLGQSKVLEWLRAAITEPQSSEEQLLRLESDADAVTVVTVHSSKGLEYPIVFCPDLWESSIRKVTTSKVKKAVLFQQNQQRIADLGSDQYEQHIELQNRETIAESLRFLYVALTRAKYRCYVAWADTGDDAKGSPSALSQLLSQHKGEDWQARLNNLADTYPDSFEYQRLSAELSDLERWQPEKVALALEVQPVTRDWYDDWRMTSYTGLSRLGTHDYHEVPMDKSQEVDDVVLPDAIDAPVVLPKGAQTGNVIHELLELDEFSLLAQGSDRVDYAAYIEKRERACLHFGLDLPIPELVDELLVNTVAAPLDSCDDHFCLMNLDEKQCIKEMPFYLSMANMDTSIINEILADEVTVQPLSAHTMRGLLTGFIDLIACYKGRYYVMDYKTNTLPSYDPEALIEGMKMHNYGLQYWLYTLVLHHYLKARLPDYNYDIHMGGVKYLFVRGMEPNAPQLGVFETLPDKTKLDELSDLFLLDS